MPPVKPHVRLGDLLIAAKVITPALLEEALAAQRTHGLRLGETLVVLGMVTEIQVAQVLSHQLSVPWVNLVHVQFSREMLNLIPPDLAAGTRMIPIYVRRMRQQGDVLFVATDDPLNDAALREVAIHVRMPVKLMVASAGDVRDALRVYYGRSLPVPTLPKPSPKPAAESIAPTPILDDELDLDDITDTLLTQDVLGKLPPEPEALREEPTSPGTPASVPPPEDAARSRPMLTLLDGTKIELPSRGQTTPSDAVGLTTRDVVLALLEKASEETSSEAVLATIVTLLLKKGLVADWEFVEQLEKVRARAKKT